jgi:YfiR/HmsC-like
LNAIVKRLLLTGLVLAASTVRGAADRGLAITIETERGVLAKLETAYLFNIARFVTWRPDDQEVRLCLPDESPLLRYAQELSGRDLGDGRRFLVGALDGSHARCDIVFIHAAFKSAGRTLPGEVSTLLVSDRPDALARGYVLQFFLQEDSVRFAANAEAVARADYRISSKLLRLARPAPGPAAIDGKGGSPGR